MLRDTLLLLLSQLLLYPIPIVNWKKHWFLWIVPPIIVGVLTQSLKRSILASVVSSLLYTFIAGVFEATKYKIEPLGGIIIGLMFAFPILLVINTAPMSITYGIKVALRKVIHRS